MKPFRWNKLKSDRLKKTRGVSFEEITSSKLIDLKNHPRKTNQKIILFEWKGYIWAAPCILGEAEIFLKTLYPSRKHTKLYRRGFYEKEKD